MTEYMHPAAGTQAAADTSTILEGTAAVQNIMEPAFLDDERTTTNVTGEAHRFRLLV